MPSFRRLTPHDRLLGVGLQTRLVAAAAVLILACGGFLAYRAVAAVGDAYRWTGAAEAATLAQGFARSGSARATSTSIERIRARAQRLTGVHPDLTGVTVLDPDARAHARATRGGRDAQLAFPILDGRGRAVAVLHLRFTLDERAEAQAAGRREVLLAGLGAGILLVIGIGRARGC